MVRGQVQQAFFFVFQTKTLTRPVRAAPAVATLCEVPRPVSMPSKHFDCSEKWNLWKHRKDVVFNQAPPSISRFRVLCNKMPAFVEL
jgi:hypothetical protein